MLKIIIGKNKNKPKEELSQLIQSLDDWQTRVALGFVKGLIDQDDRADEMEVAA